jgi:hypothetical protein
VLAAMAIDEALEKGAQAPRSTRVGLAAGGVVATLLGLALVVSGLGRGDKLGLGGAVWPWLIVCGVVVVVAGGATVFGGAWARWRVAVPAALLAPAVIAAALLGLAPRLGAERASKDMAAALGGLLRDGDLVYSYRDFHEGLPVYLGRTIGVVDSRGELGFGISHLSEAERRDRFPTAAELRPVWGGGKRVWLACNRNGPDKLDEAGLTPYFVVWQAGNRALVSDRP